MSRFSHPAGRKLVEARVAWCDGIALVTIINRRATILHFRVTGIVGGERSVRVGGNDSHALVCEPEPDTALCVLTNDDAQRILYLGKSDEE
jgi:hypothetical protein